MAASVLLGSAESTVPGFSVPGSVLVGNNGGSAPASSWNRSLERALDEASATGALNLSGRKLKEFPRSAANHDLTDTTRADLSRNRLAEVPAEVCVYVSLESLNLYHNCLRTLPDSLVNLQALTYLNISRNQLCVLPAVVCSLPLKVLIACNNKLVSLPEELGQLRHLTELDVSCNEIQVLPSQVGRLETLRDLNIRRNHLLQLPAELSLLPLVRLDFSCNKVTSIPSCYRQLAHLHVIILDHNPLQSPPAHVCIKGKIHIFKYLNQEAAKTTSDLPEFERRTQVFNSCSEDLYLGRPYGALDSGFNSVDSGDKRWSGNEPVEEQSEEQRHRRLGPPGPNGSAESEQIDFIDSCPDEDDEGRGGADGISLSSQFMAYIERRITTEGSPGKATPNREELRRHNRSVVDGALSAPPSAEHQRPPAPPGGVERVRREAQIAAQRYEEERSRSQAGPRDSVPAFAKHKSALSPTKLVPGDREQGEERAALSSTAHPSPSYPNAGGVSPSRSANHRPESFLYRLSMREDKRKGDGAPAAPPPAPPALVGEEAQLVEQLRKNIEARLKVSLPSDLGAALTDGVVLCHLANHVRPRSVSSIHVPSPAVPKLTMAKCRRNVENFLEACRRIGVPQSQLCLPLHVLEERGLPLVSGTVSALLELAPPRHSPAVTTATNPLAM
ncbi:leucine-rich repeat and calponin homology domain-containing protein 3 isoform X6 [Gadus morhua]|uniref:Calponin-homology (CH) domain-containing protein n=1 Tax=Gadus morhua TaxID=8049 RepID=A0A8C5BW65_GADMO|nr:leucine-rich repeat and calponin homology domain-containing protein 3 isoform X6 [Gadus morhua]